MPNAIPLLEKLTMIKAWRKHTVPDSGKILVEDLNV
jgi:hypothetical protein